MRFVDNFLSNLKINVAKLNLRNRILRRSVTSVETRVYPPTAITEVAMLISKLILTNRIPHQQLPQLQFCLTNPGNNEDYFFHSLIQHFNCSIELDDLFSTISGCNFTKSHRY